MDEWYYQRGETTFGPISGVMLHGLIKRGRLQDDTRVRKSGEAEWSTAAQVLADLPAVAYAASAPPEQYTNAQSFDASQPGASVIYAPPQAALQAQPSTVVPAALWVGMIFCSATLLFEITCWSSVCIQLSQSTHAGGKSHFQSPLVLMEGWGYQAALYASVISSIFIAVWQGCAFASLKRLYGGMVRRSVASGLWWFVPIASLFKPLLCLRDMRHLSRRRRDFLGLHAPFGLLLITMESLIVVRVLINIFEAMNAGTRADAGSHRVWEYISTFALIALAITLLVIVIRNFLQQRTLYAHWRDDEYWKKLDSH